MGAAILTVSDGTNGSYDLNVTWKWGYDVDAHVGIPPQWQQRWAIGVAMAQRGAEATANGFLRPYPTRPQRVHVSQLEHSASGFYVIARIIFDSIKWRVPPPYPKTAPLPPGAIP